MADLVLDLDYDITKAEAKQRKLNRELELSQKQADAIKKNIESLNSALEDEAKKQKSIRDEISQQSQEAGKLALQIERIEGGQATLDERMGFGSLDSAKKKLAEMEASLKKLENEYDKSAANSKKLTNEIAKQELKLNKQNAKTEEISDNIASSTDKQEGFNKAVNRSDTPLAKFGKRIKELVKSALIFSVITKALNGMKEALGSYLKQDSKLSASVAKLKGNLATIGATIMSSLAPYIQWVVDKLVSLTSLIGTGLAKLLGKDVKQMAKLAKTTEEVEEAAKGSLAGFDQVNTLSKAEASKGEDASVSIDTSAIDSGPLSDSMDSIVKKVNKLKGTTEKAFSKIGTSATNAFNANKPALERGWNELVKPISDWAFEDFNEVIGIFGDGVSDIIDIFSTEDFQNVANFLIEVFTAVWSFCKGGLDEAKTIFKATFDFIGGITGGFVKRISGAINVVVGIFQFFIGIIKWVAGLFTNNTELMEDGVSDMKDGFLKVINGIIDIFAGLVNALSSVVNFIWEHICGALRGLVNGVGGLVKKVGNWLGYNNWGWEWNFTTPTIPKWNPPKLATGAVIPGGSPFLAVLGDQRKGQTNIEAPLDTIKQGLAEVLAQMGGFNSQNNQPIIIQVDGREIARATRSGNDKLGTQTVFGGFANVY